MIKDLLLGESIDKEHKIVSDINDCKVTIMFSNLPNTKVEKYILENLLDTFENRIASTN